MRYENDERNRRGGTKKKHKMIEVNLNMSVNALNLHVLN